MTNSITLTFTAGVDGAIRSGGRVLNEAERAQERSPEPTHNLPEHRDFQFECGLQRKWTKSWLDPWKCLVGASVEATGPAAVLCVGRASASRASLLGSGTSPSLLHVWNRLCEYLRIRKVAQPLGTTPDNRRGVQYPRPSVVYSLRAALG